MGLGGAAARSAQTFPRAGQVRKGCGAPFGSRFRKGRGRRPQGNVIRPGPGPRRAPSRRRAPARRPGGYSSASRTPNQNRSRTAGASDVASRTAAPGPPRAAAPGPPPWSTVGPLVQGWTRAGPAKNRKKPRGPLGPGVGPLPPHTRRARPAPGPCSPSPFTTLPQTLIRGGPAGPRGFYAGPALDQPRTTLDHPAFRGVVRAVPRVPAYRAHAGQSTPRPRAAATRCASSAACPSSSPTAAATSSQSSRCRRGR